VAQALLNALRVEESLSGSPRDEFPYRPAAALLLPLFREETMAVASVSKITAASPTSFDAAVQEGLSRANRTLRGITGLHVIEQKASVRNGKIDEFRVTMEVTFILEG
jgi:dodecin